MTMSSHVAPSVAEVLRALLSERSELSEVFVVGFTEEPIAALVEVLADLTTLRRSESLPPNRC